MRTSISTTLDRAGSTSAAPNCGPVMFFFAPKAQEYVHSGQPLRIREMTTQEAHDAGLQR